MRKDQINPRNVKNAPALIYSPTFDAHMKFGDKSGQTHTGLHVISEFRTNTGRALSAADIAINTTLEGTLNGLSTQITIKDVDGRAKTFKADVRMYTNAKTSTFFPAGTDLVKAKEFINQAWKDHCTYGTSSYGGGKVDIYDQLCQAFKLNWVGMATINGQEIWIGSAHAGSVVTAFPAVNNKFT
jgi:hypothetical protein